ncbi:MAG: DegT/DnrJ/EryC1/StrS family aminotransferase [Microthrixaceae bacterium]
MIRFAAPEVSAADEAAVLRALRSGWLSTGDECAQLEDELAAFCGAGHAVALSSCTAALDIATASLRLRPGARVGVPTWTFAATAQPAAQLGAVPVLLDVDPTTLNVDPVSLEEALPDLDAVVVVHFGGVPVDRRVLDACAAAGVPVIEDAAHALGAHDHRGAMAGRSTVGACFSFYATKNLTSAEGGALVTDDVRLAAYARAQRSHGMTDDAWRRYDPNGPDRYDIVELGRKANLPDVLAALARSQLARFDEIQSTRRGLAERYRASLATVDGVDIVPDHPHPGSADHLMVVTLPDGVRRDHVVASMRATGVITHVHFTPLHRYTWFATHAAIGPSGVKAAERLADHVLSLPLHTQLSLSDVDRVATTLAESIAESRATSSRPHATG